VNEKTFGVALTKCYFCGEDDRILLNKVFSERIANKVKAAHGKVVDMEPCQKCQEYMKQGIIVIVVDDEKSEPGWNKSSLPNPHRTGHFTVLTDEAVTRFFGSSADWAIRRRFMFLDIKAAEKMGLIKAIEEMAKKETKETGEIEDEEISD